MMPAMSSDRPGHAGYKSIAADPNRLSEFFDLYGDEESSSASSVRAPQSHDKMAERPVASLSLRGKLPPRTTSFENNGPLSPAAAAAADTAQQHFPLDNIDYESDPAAVAQELSNLQALRRMSLDIGGASDPDLPSFNNFPRNEPSEDDPSASIWVPARLHPELAPQEFRSFIDTRVEQLKNGGLLPDDGGSGDKVGQMIGGFGSFRSQRGSLSRKKSMLSRQIDNTGGRAARDYRDGAEILERKRSQRMVHKPIELSDLENVSDPSSPLRKLSVTGDAEEDMPPMLPVVQRNSLRRSTRTTYRRGSTRKEGSRLSGRLTDDQFDDGKEPEKQNFSRPGRTYARQANPQSVDTSVSNAASIGSPQTASPQSARPESRSNDGPARPLADPVPKIVETPPTEDYYDDEEDLEAPPPAAIPKRVSSFDHPTNSPPSTAPQAANLHGTSPGRTQKIAQAQPQPQPQPQPHYQQHQQQPQQQPQQRAADINTIANDRLTSQFSQNTRTDQLTVIPVANDKHVDKKKVDTTRKSSWMGKVFGGDEKEGKKKLGKAKDKHDNARLDVLQTSMDSPQRGSQVFDREEVRPGNGKPGLDKSSSNSGLFSFFGGGKKKNERPGSSKGSKDSLRAVSPEPPARLLRPDIDYPYTRFPIMHERSIYRMAHLKLANPRRPLLSQVLLSNFMYGYLAKVQQNHPQIQIPGAKRPGSAEAKEAEKKKQQEKEAKEREELERERERERERELEAQRAEEQRQREMEMERELRLQEEQRMQSQEYYQYEGEEGHYDDNYVYDAATNQYYSMAPEDEHYDEHHRVEQHAPSLDLNFQHSDLGLDFAHPDQQHGEYVHPDQLHGGRAMQHQMPQPQPQQQPQQPQQHQQSRPRSRKAQYDAHEGYGSGYADQMHQQQYGANGVNGANGGYYPQQQPQPQQHHSQESGFSGGYHGGYAGYATTDPRAQGYQSQTRRKEYAYPQPEKKKQPASVYNRPERPW